MFNLIWQKDKVLNIGESQLFIKKMNYQLKKDGQAW